MDTVQFRILGSVEARVEGRRLEMTCRQRELLASLLLRPNAVIAADELVECLWPGMPATKGAVHRLHTCVGRLRHSLTPGAADRLTTRAPGYLLRVHTDELDADRFDRTCRATADAARCGGWDAVIRHSDAALRLWRGEPLADVPAHPYRSDTMSYYQEQLLQLLGHRMDALIRLGRHAEAALALDGLTRKNPFREHFTELLMTALRLDGRRAEALQAYQRTRRQLREGLGMEPGEDLRLLQQAILTDSSLEAVAN